MAQVIARGNPITLDAFYRDNTGALRDPVDPKVSIIDALGVTVVPFADPDRSSVGHYIYVYDVPADATPGAWAARWDGSIDGGPLETEDGFTVLPAGTITTASHDGLLATVAQLSTFMRLPLDTIDQDAAAEALDGASALIRDELGQDLSITVDDVYVVKSPGGRLVNLPELPVINVTLVRVRVIGVGDWRELTAGVDYEVELGRAARVWRTSSPIDFGDIRFPTLAGEWPRALDGRGAGGFVEVTNSHGYVLPGEVPAIEGALDLPKTLNTVAKRVAARGYVNPEAVTQETTGRFTNVVYGDAPGLYLSKADIASIKRYGANA